MFIVPIRRGYVFLFLVIVESLAYGEKYMTCDGIASYCSAYGENFPKLSSVNYEPSKIRQGKAGPKGDRGDQGPPGPEFDTHAFEKRILQKVKEMIRNCQVKYSESCFKLISSPDATTQLSKQELQKICEQSGGTLANLYNQEHFRIISDYIHSQVGQKYVQVTVGLTYTHKTKSFQFTNGDVKKVDFKWHSSYPNTAVGYTNVAFSVCANPSDKLCGVFNYAPHKNPYGLCEYDIAN